MKTYRICFLSGIKIPRGRETHDHLAPRSRLPWRIASEKQNIKSALGIFNAIKGDRFLCEWESQKYDLIEYAYENWHLNRRNKRLLRTALDGMPKINPCKYCVCAKYKKFCINRTLLEKNTWYR